MRRRSFLATGVLGGAVVLSGCLGGDVVHELSGKTVRVEPQEGWVEEIEPLDSSGEVEYTVRSEDTRFQVFYFDDPDEYAAYERFMSGDVPPDQPEGNRTLSTTAVFEEDRDIYEATVPQGGGRESVDIENAHYFVVDYSNYGVGPDVTEYDDALRATVSLRVVDTHLF